MKKLFISMLAAITLFASCSEEDVVSQTSGESVVSFTVTTPELASRALGDGTTATNLYYAVYDETESTVTIVESISKNGTDDSDVIALENKRTSIQLPLLNGHTYSLLFWAENEEGAYDIDFSTKSISLNSDTGFNLTGNEENYDAFYAYVQPFLVTGAKTENVELVRPFAQLNIGTTEKDIERVGEYFSNASLTQTQIKVSSVPTKMNLAEGTVSDEAELTYSLSEFKGSVTGENYIIDNEFPVAGYKYISMNYILVGSKEKTLVNVTLGSNVSGLEERTYDNVPLQANYRTNVYGELFTSQSNWNVEIEDEFNTPAYEIMDGVLVLDEDMTITTPFRVENSLAINLNGNKLIYEGNDIMIRVDDGATLTFNGPGEVESADYIASVNEGGKIYVNGGSYKGETTCFNVNGGELYITGGYFNAYNDKYQGAYTLNHVDALKNDGKIEVTGGGFYKYDPVNSSSENPVMSFVPDDYKSEQIGDVYYVTKETATAAATKETLANLLGTAQEVAMVTDVTTSDVINMTNGATLDGGNYTLTMNDIQESGSLALGLKTGGGTIKNLIIDGQNQRSTANNKGYRAIYITNPQEDVVIDNVSVTGVLYPFNTGTMSGAAEGVKLFVSNSTMEGWASFAGFESAKFDNCHFGLATYNDEGSVYNGCIRPYVTTVFENCEFEAGFKVSAKFTENGKSYDTIVTFKNCTVGGEKITETNIAEMFLDESPTEYYIE